MNFGSARARRFTCLALTSILLFALSFPHSYSQAPTPAIISEYKVKDPNGNDVTGQPLVAGGSYSITFAVTIGATLSDQILLSTKFDKVGDRFWSLENNYPGVDTSTWQPGGSSISFRAVQGTARLTVTGKIPANVTMEKLKNDKIVHFPVKIPVLIVALQSTMGILDQKIVNVTDQTLIQYENTLKSKQTVLSSSQTLQQYLTLSQSVIERAQSLAQAGHVEEATELLGIIPATGLPTPPGVETTFLYIAAALGVVAALFAVMFVRANSNKSFIARQADDKAKKLDVLLVKATRIDKGLASEIESIKKELEDLAGR